ncbi:general transcription repressor, partial [Ascosphaera atra]
MSANLFNNLARDIPHRDRVPGALESEDDNEAGDQLVAEAEATRELTALHKELEEQEQGIQEDEGNAHVVPTDLPAPLVNASRGSSGAPAHDSGSATIQGNNLADLDPDKLPASQKREGQDWYAVFNPEVTRVLDVDLVHHLVHDSVVCCVRFSADGRFVATGCNRSAQIFDVATGGLLHTLQDPAVEKDGDLYIRSVCFSPDGRLLATGAEDRQIR